MTREEAVKIIEYLPVPLTKQYSFFQIQQAYKMAIKALQAKPKTGKWIVKQGNYCGVELKEYYCDHCGTRGALRRVFSDPEPLPNFCGQCGADMRGGQDET